MTRMTTVQGWSWGDNCQRRTSLMKHRWRQLLLDQVASYQSNAPKKMKGILEETTTRLNWGHLPSSNTTSTICLKILHSTIHGKGTMSHMILMLGKLEKTQLKGRLLAEAKPSRCPFPEGWGDQIIDQRGSPPSQRMVTTVHCLKPDDAVKSYFTHRSKQTLMLRWENVLCVLRFLICYIWHILR